MAQQLRLGLGLSRDAVSGGGGAAVARPASTALLFIADPDANLSLTGANVNSMTDTIAAVTATAGGTKATRQLAVLNGYNVLRGASEQYLTPNTAAGKMDAYVSATAGCIVGVFKPAANTDYLYRSRTVSSIAIEMVDDAGTPKLQVTVRDQDGSSISIKIAAALAAWHTFTVRWTASTLYLSVDGGAESSAALSATGGGGVSNLSHRMDLLGSLDVGGTFTGDWMEMGVIAGADVAAWQAFVESEYAI